MASLQGYVDRKYRMRAVLGYLLYLSILGRVLLILQDGRAIVVRD